MQGTVDPRGSNVSGEILAHVQHNGAKWYPFTWQYVTQQAFSPLLKHCIQTRHLFGKTIQPHKHTSLRSLWGHSNNIGHLHLFGFRGANFVTQWIRSSSCVAIALVNEFNNCLHIRRLSMFPAFQRSQNYVCEWTGFEAIISDSANVFSKMGDFPFN